MTRSTSAFRRIYGSPARVQWVTALPCILADRRFCYGSRSENAHVRGGGMGRKADARWIVPLCHLHHDLLHRLGLRSFERLYGVVLLDAATVIEAGWQARLLTRRRPSCRVRA